MANRRPLSTSGNSLTWAGVTPALLKPERIMNKKLLDDGIDYIKKVHNDAILDALCAISTYQDKRIKLLNNGRPILDTTCGDRFVRLDKMRSKVYNSIYEADKIANEIAKLLD